MDEIEIVINGVAEPFTAYVERLVQEAVAERFADMDEQLNEIRSKLRDMKRQDGYDQRLSDR